MSLNTTNEVCVESAADGPRKTCIEQYEESIEQKNLDELSHIGAKQNQRNRKKEDQGKRETGWSNAAARTFSKLMTSTLW